MSIKNLCIVLSALLGGCQYSNKPITKVLSGDTLITANYNNGVIEGKAIYSTRESDRIIAHYEYKNGFKNGIGVTYYSNNLAHDSAFYLNDRKVGYYYLFDSSGNLLFKRYFIDGTAVGPIYEYKNGILSKYGFKSFEKAPIFFCEYDSVGKVKMFEGDFPFVNAYTLLGNNSEYTGLFIYFPSPPGVGFKYSLGFFNKETEEIKRICDLNSNRIFLDTLLHKPEVGWYYSVMIQYLDSTSNKVYERVKVLNKEE